MASKYGKQKYGADLYSSALAQLEGSTSASFTLAGRVTDLRTFIGAVPFTATLSGGFAKQNSVEGSVSFTMTPGVALLTKMPGYRGTTISFSMTLAGDLREIEGLRGDVLIAPDVAGRLTKLNTFIGALPFTVTLAGLPTRGITYVGNLPFTMGAAGVLLATWRLKGNVAVTPIIVGDIATSGTKKFEGAQPVDVIFGGSLTAAKPLIGGTITFTVTPSDMGIYLGSFWGPDNPDSGFWTPDVPGSGPWVPDVPVDEFWEPIPRSG